MRSRILVPLLLFSIGLPSAVSAGRVMGDIKLAGKPVAAGTVVTIALAAGEDGKAGEPVTTKTDEFGAYKLVMKETGKCVLSVVYDKQTASLEVFSNKEATRYDLVLEKKDGKYILRRK